MHWQWYWEEHRGTLKIHFLSIGFTPSVELNMKLKLTTVKYAQIKSDAQLSLAGAPNPFLPYKLPTLIYGKNGMNIQKLGICS